MPILLAFGSVLRGDNDDFSDKDYLVVGDLSSIKYDFPEKSTIVYYSKTQLLNMANAGSLFLQHLKYESRVIQDDEDWMANFLTNVKFVKPTVIEIRKCLYTLFSILILQNETQLIGWKADCLYVYLRDLIIKLLARDGNIIFSPEILADKFFIKLHSDESMAKVFLNLRVAKYNFRHGNSVDFSERDLVTIENFLFCKYGNEISVLETKKLSVAEALKTIGFQDNYHKLRFVEACYIMNNSMFKQYGDVERSIKAPNHYHAAIARLPFHAIFEEFIKSKLN